MPSFFMQAGFGLYCLFQNKESATAKIRREVEKLLALVQGLTAEEKKARKDVGRMPGVDEDMQDWSALMILEHMTLVNRASTELMDVLVAEKMPIVETDVKNAFTPHADAGEEWIAALRESADAYLEKVEGLQYLKTRSKFAHPVFGKINAFQAHCFSGVHHAMHRKQLERLIELVKQAG